MACTGVCVLETALLVGNIMEKVWNSPLKDLLRDLLKKPKAVEYFPSKYRPLVRTKRIPTPRYVIGEDVIDVNL